MITEPIRLMPNKHTQRARRLEWSEAVPAEREGDRAALRLNHVRSEHSPAPPLEQFISGFYCDRCGRGFVGDDQVNPRRLFVPAPGRGS